jgi:hypothetical protein
MSPANFGLMPMTASQYLSTARFRAASAIS